MKKITHITMAAVVCSCIACAAAYAQYVSASIPAESRLRSLDEATAREKVKAAKDLIEDKGAAAFEVFRRQPKVWLGGEAAIYVINATPGSPDEGVFVVAPAPRMVGKNALDMSTVNGKAFAAKVIARQAEGAGRAWLGFVEGEPGQLATASALAALPGNEFYVIVAGVHNLRQEEQFLVELVTTAAGLIAKDGKAAFTRFADKESPFRFKDTYLYVLDENGVMLFDPARPEYVGHNVTEFPKLFPGYVYPSYSLSMQEAVEKAVSGASPRTAREYTKLWREVVLKNGYAWAAYRTARPGKTAYVNKVSYDRVVAGPDGKVYVVGSGVYLAE